MDDIQSKDAKAKAKSKSLESQLEKMKQREAAFVARRQELEAKVAKKKRSQRTRAFVCMGALMEKLMKEDDALRQRVLNAAVMENIHNRLGLGGYTIITYGSWNLRQWRILRESPETQRILQITGTMPGQSERLRDL